VRTISTLIACALLLFGWAHCVCADFDDETWYERPDAPDLKDSRLIEHLRDAHAVGRAWAGYYLNQRWTGPKYVELLKADWQAGVIALDYWPKMDAETLTRYLLTVARPSSLEREDAAAILATHVHGDQIYTYSGPIRDRALDSWALNWYSGLSNNLADPAQLWYLGAKSRFWLREKVYKDDSLLPQFGSTWRGVPWRLREFRQVLALFSGDFDHFDVQEAAKTGWLPLLKDALSTGNCPVDVEMDDSKPEGVYDRLTSPTYFDDFGNLRYAELLCLVCDRPDWVLKARTRLQKTKIVVTEWIPNQAIPKLINTEQDLSSPLVYTLALAALGKYDDFFVEFDNYLRQKWADYKTTGVPTAVWLTHPWMKKAVRDKGFQEKWESLTIPLDWPAK
jgi:hypothetical protein